MIDWVRLAAEDRLVVVLGHCPNGCRRAMRWHEDAWYCPTCHDEWTPNAD
jgi:uncharacterized protein YcgI (DUF1989 family)